MPKSRECRLACAATTSLQERWSASGSDQLRRSAQALLGHLDARLAPDVERGALMQLHRQHVEHTNGAVARRATRLLDDEAEWVRLVQQAELSFGRLAVRRIGEDAAAEEIAMEIGDERSNVAHAQRLGAALEATVAPHQRLHCLVPELLVGIVHRQI